MVRIHATVRERVLRRCVVSRSLVGPKCQPNWHDTKGNQVNIPEPRRYATRRRQAGLVTHLDKPSTALAVSNTRILLSTVKVRRRRKVEWRVVGHPFGPFLVTLKSKSGRILRVRTQIRHRFPS